MHFLRSLLSLLSVGNPLYPLQEQVSNNQRFKDRSFQVHPALVTFKGSVAQYKAGYHVTKLGGSKSIYAYNCSIICTYSSLCLDRSPRSKPAARHTEQNTCNPAPEPPQWFCLPAAVLINERKAISLSSLSHA